MPEVSTKPGSVNEAHDPRYWTVERAPFEYLQRNAANFRGIPIHRVKDANPPLIFRTRFVLPIRGTGL